MKSLSWRNFDLPSSSVNEAQERKLTRHWYQKEGADLARAVYANVRWLLSNQHGRLMQSVLNARMYSGTSLLTYSGSAYSKMAKPRHLARERMSLNIISEGVDAIWNRIAQNKPLPVFVPVGGDYRIQRRSKKLSGFVEGVFDEQRAYELGKIVCRDSEVFGTGFKKVFVEPKTGRVRYERRLESSLHWDQEEAAACGSPRSLYEIVSYDREQLKAQFGSDTGTVVDMSLDDAGPNGGNREVSDIVRVVEAWHLPSDSDSEDGVHTICAEGRELFSEPYAHEDFPFVRMLWDPRLIGWDGIGIPEKLYAIQLEINTLLAIIQKATWAAGQRKILVERGSKIVKQHLDNRIDGTVVEYTGTKPDYVLPPIVAPEVYQHLQTLRAAAQELIGLNQMTISGSKPTGEFSGKALRTLTDLQTDRMALISQALETYYLDLARLTVRVMRDAVGGKSYKVKCPGRRFIQSIDWKDAKLDDNQFTLRCMPIDSTSKTPAARLQDVQDLKNANLISDQQAKRLLQMPTDLDRELEMETASEELVWFVIDELLQDEPNPEALMCLDEYANVNVAYPMFLQTLNWARANKVEQPKLELLMRGLKQMKAMNDEGARRAAEEQAAAASSATASAAAQGMTGPVAPQVVPGAAPAPAPSPVAAPAAA